MTAHANARLTLEQVEEIRKQRTTPCECCGRTPTLRDLGERYSVSAVAIYKILTSRRWGEPA